MRFVTGAELTDAIRRIVKGPNLEIAAAFWGNGASRFLKLGKRKDWRIVCNLGMGGTNPDALRELEDPAINRGKLTTHMKEHSRLHAKVYVSDYGAVIASANVSSNGLGFEGRETEGWIEAGMVLDAADDLTPIRAWVGQLWKEATFFSAARLDEVKPRYLRHRGNRSSHESSGMIDPMQHDFPLINWWFEMGEVPPEFTGDLRRAIEHGCAIEHKDDGPVLLPGRWILWWRMNKKGLPEPGSLTWERLGSGGVTKAALRWPGEDELDDVVLGDLSPGPPPLEIATIERRFIKLINDDPKFRVLRDENYKGTFFSPRRLNAMRKLWPLLVPS